MALVPRGHTRAIGYVRVSTDQQRESGLGLEAQDASIREAAARMGLSIASVHIDAGLSGSLSLDQRPGLAEALNALRRGDVLIVAKRDRIARDAFLSVLIEREAQRKGARIVSAAGEGTDSDDPSATFTRRILDAVAELERALTAARTRAALRAKRARGERAGCEPYGYRVNGDQRTTDRTQRVTLSKADQSTAPGRELIALLTELSADGQVTREEMDRLRIWLEVDRGVDFPSCGFLYGVLEPMTQSETITEDHLDTLALAIERVLPKDARAAAALQRKRHRLARRAERAEARANQLAAKINAREQAKPLHRGDFVIAGALRSAERREACGLLSIGENVVLERERDNVHDANAILICAEGGDELGYVPREDAREMAPLLDSGAQAQVIVKKLLETASGHTLPVVISKLYRDSPAAGDIRPSVIPPMRAPSSEPVSAYEGGNRARAVQPVLIAVAVAVLLLALSAYCAR